MLAGLALWLLGVEAVAVVDPMAHTSASCLALKATACLITTGFTAATKDLVDKCLLLGLIVEEALGGLVVDCEVAVDHHALVLYSNVEV